MTDERPALRVALLTNILPPYRVAFYNALARQVDLTVIAHAVSSPDRWWHIDPQDCAFRLQLEGGIRVPVARTGAAGHVETRYLLFPLGTWRRLRKLRPHVIVSGELGLHTAQAVWYGRSSSTPVVCYWEGTGHTEARVSRQRHYWRGRLVRGVDAAWVNGRESRDYLAGLGVPAASITEAMTGVDARWFHCEALRLRTSREFERARLGLRGLVFGYSGALSERKGISELLAACHELLALQPAAKFSLLFIGDGAARPLVDEWARSHLTVPVRITGFVQQPSLPGLYSAVDWCVLPTLEDCWALATLEPLACGIPQLFSRYNGASADLAALPGSGLTVDPLDISDLCAGLRQALACGPCPVPEATVRHAVEHYDSEAQARRAFESLAMLANSRTRTEAAVRRRGWS